MGLSREGGAHRCVAGLESVQRPGTLRQEILAALLAPMFWKTGLPPGLLVSEDEAGWWAPSKPAAAAEKATYGLRSVMDPDARDGSAWATHEARQRSGGARAELYQYPPRYAHRGRQRTGSPNGSYSPAPLTGSA